MTARTDLHKMAGGLPIEPNTEVVVTQLVNGTAAPVITGPLLGVGDNPCPWVQVGSAAGDRFVFLGPGIGLSVMPTGDGVHPALR